MGADCLQNLPTLPRQALMGIEVGPPPPDQQEGQGQPPRQQE